MTKMEDMIKEIIIREMIAKKMIEEGLIIAIIKGMMADTKEMTGREIGNNAKKRISTSILTPISGCTIKMITNSTRLSLKKRSHHMSSKYTCF